METSWKDVIIGVIIAVVVLALLWFFWTGNNKNADKSKEIQIACIEKGGIWLESSDACTWTN